MGKKLFRLAWGIHSGTMMSRDVGDPYYFDTVEECKNEAIELRDYFKEKMNYKLWFANAHNEKTKQSIKLLEGEPCQ